MNAAGSEIIILLLLIAINGILAMSEMALAAARKARLQQAADAGDQGARIALELLETPTRFLSTVQIGITLIGILSGAFGGATLARNLADFLQGIPLLAPYSQAISIGVVVLAVTYLSLVFGELVPKRLALANAERIAARMSPAMLRLARLTSPVVRLLSVSTEAVVRLLGVITSDAPEVTEEEVRLLIRTGAASGLFEPDEHEIFTRVLRLGDRKVSSLITHRTELDWLDLEDTSESLRAQLAQAQHSRLPVAAGDLDELLGILYLRDLWSCDLDNLVDDLRRLMRPADIVPEAMTILELLKHFKQTHSHLAMVVDEYGGIAGLVTTNDVLEAIVGNLPATGNPDEAQAIRRADGSWLFDGTIPVEEVKTLLDLDELPGEADGNYETLAGLVMEQMGRIPISGDAFEWNGLRFEVVDMDGFRIDKVLVAPVLD